MKFTSLPAWVMPPAPDALALFEAVALADLEDCWIRLDAATQRALIGFPVFGKRSILISASGELRVARSVGFGTDCEVAIYGAESVRKAASGSLQLSPGMSGPGYLC